MHSLATPMLTGLAKLANYSVNMSTRLLPESCSSFSCWSGDIKANTGNRWQHQVSVTFAPAVQLRCANSYAVRRSIALPTSVPVCLCVFVCVCVSLSAQKLTNYLSEINVTWFRGWNMCYGEPWKLRWHL